MDTVAEQNALGIEEPSALGLLQSLLIQPVWLAIVWAVRAVLTVLEWSFSVDLVRSRSTAAAMLGETDRLSLEWLPFALAIGAAIVGTQGLIQRRVPAALGVAGATLAFVALGLGLAADEHLVATAAELSDRTAQEILAVSAVDGGQGGVLHEVGEATVERPWCYLEFGAVDWCMGRPRADLVRDAHALDRDVRGPFPTVASVFLAFPAESSGRASLERSGSLVGALCGAEELSACHGETAARVQFMSTAGTWSRVGGLVLIAAGDVGLLLLFGSIGVRVLVAAAAVLLLLALAPIAVIAAPLGARGRHIFQAWFAALCRAVVTKVALALALALLIAMFAAVWHVVPGFWVGWLMASALAWGVFFGRGTISSAIGGDGRLRAAAHRLVPSVAEARGHRALRAAPDAPRAPAAISVPTVPLLNAPRHPAPSTARRASPGGFTVGDPSPANRPVPRGAPVEGASGALRRAQDAYEAQTGSAWNNAQRARVLAQLAGLDYGLGDASE